MSALRSKRDFEFGDAFGIVEIHEQEIYPAFRDAPWWYRFNLSPNVVERFYVHRIYFNFWAREPVVYITTRWKTIIRGSEHGTFDPELLDVKTELDVRNFR